MFHDLVYNLINCERTDCFVWHGSFALAVFLLGLGLARHLWHKPWRKIAEQPKQSDQQS